MKLFSFFSKKKLSRNVAKDRLKILLISDRTDCSPEMMDMIKNDIITVISKYMRIDANSTEIEISQAKSRERGNVHPSLYAHLPILDMRKV